MPERGVIGVKEFLCRESYSATMCSTTVGYVSNTQPYSVLIHTKIEAKACLPHDTR